MLRWQRKVSKPEPAKQNHPALFRLFQGEIKPDGFLFLNPFIALPGSAGQFRQFDSLVIQVQNKMKTGG